MSIWRGSLNAPIATVLPMYAKKHVFHCDICVQNIIISEKEYP